MLFHVVNIGTRIIIKDTILFYVTFFYGLRNKMIEYLSLSQFCNIKTCLVQVKAIVYNFFFFLEKKV